MTSNCVAPSLQFDSTWLAELRPGSTRPRELVPQLMALGRVLHITCPPPSSPLSCTEWDRHSLTVLFQEATGAFVFVLGLLLRFFLSRRLAGILLRFCLLWLLLRRHFQILHQIKQSRHRPRSAAIRIPPCHELWSDRRDGAARVRSRSSGWRRVCMGRWPRVRKA